MIPFLLLLTAISQYEGFHASLTYYDDTHTFYNNIHMVHGTWATNVFELMKTSRKHHKYQNGMTSTVRKKIKYVFII